MVESKITSKNQTTVPRDVRDRLGIGPGTVLRWEVRGNGEVRLRVAGLGFLGRRGSIQVGPGSAVEDVHRARISRGRNDA